MACTAVVTGGFGALGRAVAGTMLARGWNLALPDAGASVPEGLRDDARTLLLPSIDLADPAAAQESMKAAAERFGGIDALVNVAGTFRWEPLAEHDPRTWALLHRVNLQTAVESSKAALPYLRGSRAGRIVNIGAFSALRAAAGLAAYTASKSGVHRFTESLADELKDSGITVNAVLPSIIDTPANRASMPDADHTRWVSPDALAAVVAFLASDAASAITGALIPVTGRV